LPAGVDEVEQKYDEGRVEAEEGGEDDREED